LRGKGRDCQVAIKKNKGGDFLFSLAKKRGGEKKKKGGGNENSLRNAPDPPKEGEDFAVSAIVTEVEGKGGRSHLFSSLRGGKIKKEGERKERIRRFSGAQKKRA